MSNNPRSWDIKHEAALAVTKKAALSTQEVINLGFDLNADVPYRMFATLTPDAVMNFAASAVTSGDGSKKVVAPFSSSIKTVAAQTINFQTQVVSSEVLITFPASTLDFFRICSFVLTDAGKIQATFSAEAVSIGALVNPGTLFTTLGTPIGYAVLKCTNATGLFKTANSVTSIIENADLYRLSAGSSAAAAPASSGSGVTCIIAEVPAGLVNDSNTSYTLSYAPTTAKMALVIINGLINYVTTHYTLTGTALSFVTAPSTGDRIIVIYVTDSRLVQKASAVGDGTTLIFRNDYSLDMLPFLNGLLSEPGTDCRVSSNMVEFFAAPEVESATYVVATGFGQFSQAAMSGTVNGSNTVFTLATAPTVAGAVIVVLNGRVIAQGAGANRCTVSGSTVTFGTAPVTGQTVYGIVYNS